MATRWGCEHLKGVLAELQGSIWLELELCLLPEIVLWVAGLNRSPKPLNLQARPYNSKPKRLRKMGGFLNRRETVYLKLRRGSVLWGLGFGVKGQLGWMEEVLQQLINMQPIN